MNIASSNPYHSSQRSVLEKDHSCSLEDPDTNIEAGDASNRAVDVGNDVARTDEISGGERFSNGKDEPVVEQSECALDSPAYFLKS
jgi:hypothetical protein